jgi:hypothetical protein
MPLSQGGLMLFEATWEVKVYDEFDDPESVSTHSFNVEAGSLEAALTEANRRLSDEVRIAYPDQSHGSFVDAHIVSLTDASGVVHRVGPQSRLDNFTFVEIKET